MVMRFYRLCAQKPLDVAGAGHCFGSSERKAADGDDAGDATAAVYNAVDGTAIGI